MPDKEFKVMIIKIFTGLEKKMMSSLRTSTEININKEPVTDEELNN